jgi:hypothetical protein
MCKGRPRRTGERVCGRTCRERERQARLVQGSYSGYDVSVVRRESHPPSPNPATSAPQLLAQNTPTFTPAGPSGTVWSADNKDATNVDANLRVT